MVKCVYIALGFSPQDAEGVVEQEPFNYEEEQAQEMVQTMLQEVVNTVVGGNTAFS